MADISGTFRFVPDSDVSKEALEVLPYGTLSLWDSSVISGAVSVGSDGTYGYRRVRLIPMRLADQDVFFAKRCNPINGQYTFYGVPPGLWEVIVYGEGIHRSIVHGPVTIT